MTLTYAAAHDLLEAYRDARTIYDGDAFTALFADEAELTLDVNVLGAGFLGHGIGGLLRAGLVREHRPGAYAELARAMRTLVAPEPSIGF